jgi:hypothetical protein
MALLNQQLDTELKAIQCGTCGVWHAIPQAMFDKCYQEGGFWHCPNGHSRGYSDGSIRKQLEKEEKRRKWAEQAESDRRQELIDARKKLSAQKGVNTRLKNRAKAGVCPCCNRTFKQLAAHMQNKHPDFTGDDT